VFVWLMCTKTVKLFWSTKGIAYAASLRAASLQAGASSSWTRRIVSRSVDDNDPVGGMADGIATAERQGACLLVDLVD
jgi:hypothetical protein